MITRLFDIFVSFIGIVILSPLFFIILVLIRSEGEGPLLYKAQRVGKNGKTFSMFKFRTMVVGADLNGPSSASTSDIRITRTGKFLRKYKLDELPQLINVLTGQMSIVGPRPEIKKFTDLFTYNERKILSVKPGITDWASIWNSNEGQILEGAEDPDKVYVERIRPEKIRLQLQYVENHNFFIDLKIVILTIKKIIFRNVK